MPNPKHILFVAGYVVALLLGVLIGRSLPTPSESEQPGTLNARPTLNRPGSNVPERGGPSDSEVVYPLPRYGAVESVTASSLRLKDAVAGETIEGKFTDDVTITLHTPVARETFEAAMQEYRAALDAAREKGLSGTELPPRPERLVSTKGTTSDIAVGSMVEIMLSAPGMISSVTVSVPLTEE